MDVIVIWPLVETMHEFFSPTPVQVQRGAGHTQPGVLWTCKRCGWQALEDANGLVPPHVCSRPTS